MTFRSSFASLRPLATRLLAASVMSLSLLSAAACGDGAGMGSGGAISMNIFFIPTPAESSAMGQGQGQGACATGTSAYDLVVEIIDRENAALDADRELLEAALAAAPEGEGPIQTYEAEVDGRTLSIEMVSAGSEVAVTGTLIDDEGEHDYLSGALAEDEAQGALVISPPDGEELNVAWNTVGGVKQFARTHGDSTTAYDDSDDSVRIATDDAVVSWDKAERSGTVIQGSDIRCFEGGELADDFCDATCSGDMVGDLDDIDF